MKNFFKSEDFYQEHFNLTDGQCLKILDYTNAKLNELIESCQEVSGTVTDSGLFRLHNPYDGIVRECTHKARLAFVEEIVKKPCEHEPFYEEYGGGLRSPAKCKHCGVELQATWSEAKK